MASHNFIRNEVFDENVDRLNELTNFVITQQKTAEYDALIAELDAQRIELGGVMPRDQAAIDVVATRLRDVTQVVTGSCALIFIMYYRGKKDP